MLKCRSRFQASVHAATVCRFHSFLRVAECEFAQEMRVQIRQHVVDMPAITDNDVYLVREGRYAFGSSRFTLFWKVATCADSQSSWGA